MVASRVLFSLGILLFAAGCSTGNGGGPVSGDRKAEIEGPIVPQLEELQAHPNAESCDKKIKTQQMEVARDLDSKAEEIKAATLSLPPSKAFKRVQLGKLSLRQRIEDWKPRDGWQADFASWSDILAHYQNIKAAAVDKDWIWLNSAVRSILFDDRFRIMELKNVYLDHTSGPIVQSTMVRVEACVADSACDEIPFSAEEAAFIAENPTYKKRKEQLDAAKADRGEWRKRLEGLAKSLDWDYDDYRIRIDSSVQRKQAQTIEVPLLPGDLDEAAKGIAKFIEDVWTSSDLNVKIRWVSAPETPSIFRVVLESSSGGRPFVRYRDRTMHLYQDTRVKSLPHEVGHILGLPDRYYTIWNPQMCEYKTEYNEQDIMSDSELGSVLAADWDALKANYPATP